MEEKDKMRVWICDECGMRTGLRSDIPVPRGLFCYAHNPRVELRVETQKERVEEMLRRGQEVPAELVKELL